MCVKGGDGWQIHHLRNLRKCTDGETVNAVELSFTFCSSSSSSAKKVHLPFSLLSHLLWLSHVLFLPSLIFSSCSTVGLLMHLPFITAASTFQLIPLTASACSPAGTGVSVLSTLCHTADNNVRGRPTNTAMTGCRSDRLLLETARCASAPDYKTCDLQRTHNACTRSKVFWHWCKVTLPPIQIKSYFKFMFGLSNR